MAVLNGDVEAEALFDNENCADNDADGVNEVIAVILLEMRGEKDIFEEND